MLTYLYFHWYILDEENFFAIHADSIEAILLGVGIVVNVAVSFGLIGLGDFKVQLMKVSVFDIFYFVPF